jgi:hypothetical protein
MNKLQIKEISHLLCFRQRLIDIRPGLIEHGLDRSNGFEKIFIWQRRYKRPVEIRLISVPLSKVLLR